MCMVNIFMHLLRNQVTEFEKTLPNRFQTEWLLNARDHICSSIDYILCHQSRECRRKKKRSKIAISVKIVRARNLEFGLVVAFKV